MAHSRHQSRTISRTDEEWEAMREPFRKCYVDQDMSLKQTTQHLAVHHGFAASERQWERKKEDWNFSKYQKRETRQQYIEQALAKGMNMEDILKASNIPIEGADGDDRAARRNWRRYVKRERTRSPVEGTHHSFEIPGASRKDHHVVEKTYDVNVPDGIILDQATGALPDSIMLEATSSDSLGQSQLQVLVVNKVNPSPDTNPAPEIVFSTWDDASGGLQDHGRLPQMSFTNYADMSFQLDNNNMVPSSGTEPSTDGTAKTYETYPIYQQAPNTTDIGPQTTYIPDSGDWSGERVDNVAYDSTQHGFYETTGDVTVNNEPFPPGEQVPQLQFDPAFDVQSSAQAATPRPKAVNDYFQSMTADPLAVDLSNIVDMYTNNVQKMIKTVLAELPKADPKVLQKIEEGLQTRRDLYLRTMSQEIKVQAINKQRALESIREKRRNLEQIMAEKGINTRAELRELKARTNPRQSTENDSLAMSQFGRLRTLAPSAEIGLHDDRIKSFSPEKEAMYDDLTQSTPQSVVQTKAKDSKPSQSASRSTRLAPYDASETVDKLISGSVVHDEGEDEKRKSDHQTRSSQSIILPLIAVTATYLVIFDLCRCMGSSPTFKTFSFSYLFLIMITSFWQNHNANERIHVHLTNSTNATSHPFGLACAIISTSWEFISFVGTCFKQYAIVTMVCFSEAGGTIHKSFVIALSSMMPEVTETKGNVRIRWTCKCGMRLYDDFQELRAGAALDLLEQLSHGQTASTHESHGPENLQSIAGSPATNNSQQSQYLFTQNSLMQSVSAPEASTFQRSSGPNNAFNVNQANLPTRSLSDLYLLSCISQGRYSTFLRHIDVKDTKCDFELMTNIRNAIKGCQSSYFPAWLQFQTFSSIEFVSFELHRKQLVDIRKRDDIPPESRKNEYVYTPMPADLIPPIGKNYLMHVYHHPEDAGIDSLCLDRFPKRKTGRLQRGDGQPVQGWGIHFSLGYDSPKICLIAFLCVLCSTAFAIAWSVVRNDVQGGFAIGAYILALLGLGMGSLQIFAM